jgi:hypothetical protein
MIRYPCGETDDVRLLRILPRKGAAVIHVRPPA